MLWERRLDTMALISWGANRIVVVFRGTNSLKNVKADLEVREHAGSTPTLRLAAEDGQVLSEHATTEGSTMPHPASWTVHNCALRKCYDLGHLAGSGVTLQEI